MIAEALVIFACVNNTGCTETSNQYFLENPQVKQIIDKDAQEAKELVGPKIVDAVGPFLFVAAGGTGTIKLSEHFSLQANQTSATLSFRWNL